MKTTRILLLVSTSLIILAGCNRSKSSETTERFYFSTERAKDQALPEKTGEFRWSNDRGKGEYIGTFDAQEYSLLQIQNTYGLLHGSMLYPDGSLDCKLYIETLEIFENRPDIDTVNKCLAALRAEYKEKKTKLQNLEVANTPYWQNYKKQRLQYFDDRFEVTEMMLQAHHNPSVLLQSRFSTDYYPELAAVLNSTDAEILAYWEKRLLESQWERIQDYKHERKGSADRLDYAKTTLLYYWESSVNLEQIPDASEEFMNLFWKVTNMEDLEYVWMR
jgi:hypothetical protein